MMKLLKAKRLYGLFAFNVVQKKMREMKADEIKK